MNVGVRDDALFAGVARQQVHQKMRLAVAVSKFAFTLKSRFYHRVLLWSLVLEKGVGVVFCAFGEPRHVFFAQSKISAS